jgi:hypothetical protein
MGFGSNDSQKPFNDMDIDKVGYCLRPGCPVKHALTYECWRYVTRFIQTGKSYNDYVKACKNK